MGIKKSLSSTSLFKSIYIFVITNCWVIGLSQCVLPASSRLQGGPSVTTVELRGQVCTFSIETSCDISDFYQVLARPPSF